jgi:hypothetical protein
MNSVLNKLHDIADKLKALETHYSANNKEPLSDEEVKLLEVLNATINSLDDVDDDEDAAINNEQSNDTQDKNGNSK